MQEMTRKEPLPRAMQGQWIDIDDPSTVLMVDGGEITYFGKTVEYDYKIISEEDGAMTVSLKASDPAAEGNFQRANITELVVTPDGDFHAFNVKFASQFVRADT